MDAPGVHQHEAEQGQPGQHDHDQEAFHREPVPGKEPAHHGAHIRKDADDHDGPEIELGRSDEAAADVDRRGSDEGYGGHPEHGLMEVDRDPLGFSHGAFKYNGYSGAFQQPGRRSRLATAAATSRQ